jgi:hypothetical protein
MQFHTHQLNLKTNTGSSQLTSTTKNIQMSIEFTMITEYFNYVHSPYGKRSRAVRLKLLVFGDMPPEKKTMNIQLIRNYAPNLRWCVYVRRQTIRSKVESEV